MHVTSALNGRYFWPPKWELPFLLYFQLVYTCGFLFANSPHHLLSTDTKINILCIPRVSQYAIEGQIFGVQVNKNGQNGGCKSLTWGFLSGEDAKHTCIWYDWKDILFSFNNITWFIVILLVLTVWQAFIWPHPPILGKFPWSWTRTYLNTIHQQSVEIYQLDHFDISRQTGIYHEYASLCDIPK